MSSSWISTESHGGTWLLSPTLCHQHHLAAFAYVMHISAQSPRLGDEALAEMCAGRLDNRFADHTTAQSSLAPALPPRPPASPPVAFISSSLETMGPEEEIPSLPPPTLRSPLYSAEAMMFLYPHLIDAIAGSLPSVRNVATVL